ncbi:hypothetical protein MMC25_003254 [Agyrium rufum]|nr:hypothetical protein [Agyrium rufum]
MGSRAEAEDDAKKEIHVLVTGFGPFGPYTINPSHPIALTLPHSLALKSHPTVTVSIHPLPKPIRVSYQTVRSLVPQLLFPPNAPSTSRPQDRSNESSSDTSSDISSDRDEPSKAPFDLVLFIGMAPRRIYYAAETRAHRDGYIGVDADGRNMAKDDEWTKGVYEGAPEILKSKLDIKEDVLPRWKEKLGSEIDVRASNDAGRYLCDFIYYTGLIEYWRHDRDGDRPVAFLHVPGNHEQEDVERGGKVATALVESMVESWLESKDGRKKLAGLS